MNHNVWTIMELSNFQTFFFKATESLLKTFSGISVISAGAVEPHTPPQPCPPSPIYAQPLGCSETAGKPVMESSSFITLREIMKPGEGGYLL